MFCKLGLLSLAPLAITTILSAQLVEAEAAHRWFSGEHQSNEDQRGAHYQEQRGHHNHGHYHGHHHGHDYNPNQLNDRFPSIGYNGPPFYGPVYGNQHRGGAYPGQGFGSQEPSFGINGQQGVGFGGRSPNGGYGGRPGFGNAYQPRPGHGGGVPPYQSGQPGQGYGPNGFQQPEQGYAGGPLQPQPEVQQPGVGLIFNGVNPLQPRPGQGLPYPGGPQQPSQSQSGSVGNTLQPRPEQGTADPFGVQKPDEGFSFNNDNSFQPRPGQGLTHPGTAQLPNQSQPGSIGNPLQPRPGKGTTDTIGNQLVEEGSLFNSAIPQQPRPGQGQPYTGRPIQSQPGSIGSPLQPRPGQGTTDPFGLQQPDEGFSFNGQGLPHSSGPNQSQSGSGSPLQPRPEQGQIEQSYPIGLQQPSQGQSGSPLQPRPGQVSSNLISFPHAEHTGNVPSGDSFQSHPKDFSVQPHSGQHNQTSSNLDQSSDSNQTDHTVDDNIFSIFNTKENDIKPLSVDTQPQSIEGRFLLSTDPKCKEGSDVRSGRCRQSA
ncbi:uncharacterized protein LOC117568492 [Drosophila albomicans]|uniref:Uncharacterized protein LOC117568492 n=1 Tax=Drosophila albomicans TaxID=7291 RepID=A0A6P8YAH8_DROAB|nr:uncharacterized protein LOC117568492 [Drosophila albomicans]